MEFNIEDFIKIKKKSSNTNLDKDDYMENALKSENKPNLDPKS